MDRLLEWFRGHKKRQPACPALFRVRDLQGMLVPRVQMSGVFEPSGRRLEKDQRTASGMCMVTWPVNAQRLVLTLRANGGTAEVEVNEPRPEPDRVIEVRLQ